MEWHGQNFLGPRENTLKSRWHKCKWHVVSFLRQDNIDLMVTLLNMSTEFCGPNSEKWQHGFLFFLLVAPWKAEYNSKKENEDPWDFSLLAKVTRFPFSDLTKNSDSRRKGLVIVAMSTNVPKDLVKCVNFATVRCRPLLTQCFPLPSGQKLKPFCVYVRRQNEILRNW